MKTLATTISAEVPHHETHAVVRTLGMVLVSLVLGVTAALVAFGAAAAFEVQGRTSKGELIAPCVAAALYLAFCQFWVAPRGRSGLWAKLPTLVASVVPLLLDVNLPPRIWGIPWVIISGCFGSVIGASSAHWLTTRPQGGIPLADSTGRDRSCRRNLLAGFILFVAIALMISIGVIPSVLADTSPGFNAGPVGKFLGITVIFYLLAAALLGSAVWIPRHGEPFSKATLGTAAFLGLLLGLSHLGTGVLTSGHGPALRIASVLLILCAVCGFITTALMTATSVIVDRSRLSNLDTVK
jgi:hypothetical protein